MLQQATSKHDEEVQARRKAMLDWIGEKMLMTTRFLPALAAALGLILALAKVPPAQAQVTLDISKITCDQYNAYKVTNPQNIAIWVNGYYHGKRGDVTLETQRLVENARKLRDYCRRNRETLVLEAVETLFAKDR
jgi:acid stress chaperone HdeB